MDLIGSSNKTLSYVKLFPAKIDLMESPTRSSTVILSTN